MFYRNILRCLLGSGAICLLLLAACSATPDREKQRPKPRKAYAQYEQNRVTETAPIRRSLLRV